ncbi:MAG: hypothetical protein ACPL0A_00190 [Candidatus Micrarchaeia archaeon]
MQRVLVFILLTFAPFVYSANFTYLDPSFFNPLEAPILTSPDPLISMLYDEPCTDVSISYFYDFPSSDIRLVADALKDAKEAEDGIDSLCQRRRIVFDRIADILELGTISTTSALVSALLPVWSSLFITVSLETGIQLTLEGLEVMEDTVDYYGTLIDSVEKSELAYNKLLSQVSDEYRELEHMGITSKYTGSYSNKVSELNFMLNSIDANTLVEREGRIKELLAQIHPSTRQTYASIIASSKQQVIHIIDGKESVLNTLLNAYLIEREIREGLLLERNTLSTTFSSRYSTISSRYAGAALDYGGITDADVVFFGITSIETLDSPSTHLALAGSQLAEAKYNAERGEAVYSMKMEGYVVDSIGYYYKASSNLDSAAKEIDNAERLGQSILGMAKNNVNSEYSAAYSEVQSFRPQTQDDLERLNRARKLLEEADSLIKKQEQPSKMMQNLREAYLKIKTARTYVSSSASFYSNTRDAAINSLNYLKGIIDRAKQDDIDVSYEEYYYNAKIAEVSSGNMPVFDMIKLTDDVRSISMGLFEKGYARYSYLQTKYNYLISQANYIRYLTGDDIAEAKELSKYVNENGQFNKYLSLGSYKRISGILSSLELQIALRSRDIIQSSLARNAKISSLYENTSIYLDQPVRRRISFSTYSNLIGLNYSGPVTFSVPFEYNINSMPVKSNQANLEYNYNSGKLTIMIKEFKPNTLYELVFEGAEILVRTMSAEQEVKYISQDKMKVYVEKTILSMGSPHLYFTSDYDYEYSAYLDGDYVGKFSGDGKINRYISPGQHRLLFEYVVKNPVSVEVYNTSQTQSMASVVLKVRSMTGFDVNNARISAELPLNLKGEFSFFSGDCTIANKEYINKPSSTILSFVIKELPAYASCTIHANVIASYNETYLYDELRKVKNDPYAYENTRIQGLISEAQKKMDTGDYAIAFRLIDEAKRLLEEAKREDEKVQETNKEINNLSSYISEAIQNLSNSKDERIAKVVVSAKEAYDAAMLEKDSGKKLSQLRKSQSAVLGVNSIVYSDLSAARDLLSTMKQEWLNMVDAGYVKDIPENLSAIEDALDNFSIKGDFPSQEELSALSSLMERTYSLYDATQLEKSNYVKWESNLKVQFKSLQSRLSDKLNQLTKACSTKCPSDIVSYAESLLRLSPLTASEYASGIKYLEETISNIDAYILSEKESANRAIGELKDKVAETSDAKEKETLIRKAHDIESTYDKGEYSKARESALAVLSAFAASNNTAKKEDYNLIIAGVAAIIIAFLLVKMKEKGKGVQNEIRRQLEKA